MAPTTSPSGRVTRSSKNSSQHPRIRTPTQEPNWRVAGPLLGADAKQKLMGILTCAAVRERIQRRIKDYESKRSPGGAGGAKGSSAPRGAKRLPGGDDGEW